jgi:hypothetical protein
MSEFSAAPATLSDRGPESIALADEAPEWRVHLGERKGSDELLTLVYEELRRLADRLLAAKAPGRRCKPPPSSTRPISA